MPDEFVPIALLLVSLLDAVVVILAAQSLLGWIRARHDDEPGGWYDLPEVEVEDESHALRLVRRLVAPLARRLKPEDEEELSGLKLTLARAGLNSPSAVDTYVMIQVLSLVLGLMLAVPWFMVAKDPGLLLIGLSASAGIGLLLPKFWINWRTTERRNAIAEALASTLDLLVTCMEAGLGLEQALERVATELDYSEPVMAEEFEITISEMKAGIPVAGAFRKLAQRVDLEEMHMLCGVIIQSSTLGASIGQMLRQYAASWRTQRMMDLEEKAGKMTAGLTLPLTLCLLPSAVIAMLGPAAIVVIRNIG